MLLLTVAVKERRDGVWTRYPEKVYIHTMRAFSQFIDFYREATGHEGYGKALWPLRYVNAKVFRFGVLEYELEDGEISVHIPAKSRLTPETVQASLDEETAFMKEFFPECAGCTIYCHSWLLAPALDDMLPANSSIRWFRSIFDITGYDPNDDLYLEFAFKLEYFQRMNGVDFNALREDTSLQRALKKFVLAGGNLGAGIGVLRSYNVM